MMSDKSEITIAEKLEQLRELVAWFESDEFSIEQALDKFAQAEKLAQTIDEDLSVFKNKITVLKKDFSTE
jgi:exodeoxyribonuclease VII small subunit